MITKFLEQANSLGHNKLLLHTQTHTWLAAKLYMDLGFEPFNIKENIKGWQILKTITNHEKLKDIMPINEEEMYFKTALLIKDQLDKIFKSDYEYSIWHKNGRQDVEVNKNGTLYKFKYLEENGNIKLIKEN